jgi:Tfp pilus assembly PilM family ATPase
MIDLSSVQDVCLRTFNRRRKPGLIGVDVGSRMIKLAQFTRTATTTKLTALRLVPVTSGRELTADGIEAGGIGESLDDVSIRQFGFKGSRAACALPTSIAEPRSLQLPRASEAELRQMVESELKVDPATGSETVVDLWSPDGTSGEEEMQKVSALAVRKNVAARCAEDLLASRLQCEFLDGIPFAMARAVNLVDDDRTEPVASLDWGHGSPLLTVSVNGEPRFSRVLRGCGFANVERATQKTLGTDWVQTARLLTACGLALDKTSHAHPAAVALRRTLTPEVDRLAEQIRRTISFLGIQQRAILPKRLWVFGGGGTIGGVGEELSRRLNLDCRSWGLRPDQVDRRLGTLAHLSLFGVAAGLSLLMDQS